MLLGWTWLVCFPNPLVLPRNLYRYFRFPVDPSVVQLLPTDLPADPARLEDSLKAYVPFQWDWQTYGVPWMMPDPRDVARRRKGDCESIAVLFASVLRARGIPFDVQASFSHVWIDYPGKRQTSWEQDGTSYFGRRRGRLFLEFPAALKLRQHWRNQKEGLWDAMPQSRKALLLGGWAVLTCLRGQRRRRTTTGLDAVSPPAAPAEAAASGG